MSKLLLVVGLSIAAIVVAYGGVATLHRWAERRHILDIPNARSSHTRPTPRGGGLAIVLVVLGGLLIFLSLPRGSTERVWLMYIAGAALIAAVSWLDDLRSLSNRVRFGVHIVAATLAVLAFGYASTVRLPLIGAVHPGLLGLPLALLWIIGLTNAYNFMDGIDGLAGGQALVAGLGWAVIGWLAAMPVVGLLGLLLAAASLGFLGHNWSPARIFMGDVGSAFLGYTFAALAIVAVRQDDRLACTGLLFLWPFVFDAGFTFLRRLKNGENVFAAHRSHLYQRLVISGQSHRTVALLYMGLAVWGTALGLLWYGDVAGGAILIAVTIPVLCAALWLFTSRRESAHHARSMSLRMLQD